MKELDKILDNVKLNIIEHSTAEYNSLLHILQLVEDTQRVKHESAKSLIINEIINLVKNRMSVYAESDRLVSDILKSAEKKTYDAKIIELTKQRIISDTYNANIKRTAKNIQDSVNGNLTPPVNCDKDELLNAEIENCKILSMLNPDAHENVWDKPDPIMLSDDNDAKGKKTVKTRTRKMQKRRKDSRQKDAKENATNESEA